MAKITRSNMPGAHLNAVTDDKLSLAENIAKLSDGMAALLKSGLNKKAIVILLQDHLGGRGSISRAQITDVLDALPELKKAYTNV